MVMRLVTARDKKVCNFFGEFLHCPSVVIRLLTLLCVISGCSCKKKNKKKSKFQTRVNVKCLCPEQMQGLPVAFKNTSVLFSIQKKLLIVLSFMVTDNNTHRPIEGVCVRRTDTLR